MRNYPIPFNEEARLRALHAVPGLSRDNDPVFDAICDAARKLFDCPIAHVSVIEADEQWYKSVVGIDLGPMPKTNSFCTYTITRDDGMVIPDLGADPEFRDHPMVREGGPGARFYAGVPLVLSSGHRFGSLCVLDLKPHEAPDAAKMAILRDLGRAVVAALEKAPATPADPAPETGPSAFISLIGHELRTPLTVILGSFKLLAATLEEPRSRALADAAKRSSEHLAKLIETIISYSDIATGGLRLRETDLDLNLLLADIAAMQGATLMGARAAIETVPGEGPLWLRADPEQLELALTALTLNAVLHGGDRITIGAGLDAEGHVELWVRDNGRLDPALDLGELYKPFVVGGEMNHRGTKGGLGFGLPLTRKLVEMHGGEFTVQPGADETLAVIRLPKWRREVAGGQLSAAE